MRVLWPTVVAPLIEACRPATIVELGGAGEDMLGEILDQSAKELGAVVLRAEQLTSAGPPSPDLALIYGDPNWHTVSGQLDLLAEVARAGGAAFPVTLVHGVDWPTGRRDAYPDPEKIPAEDRQPHRPEGGVERALDQHELRNGVLTAVEDFLGREDNDLRLVHIPGLGGIALLVAEHRLQAVDSRALADLIGEWQWSQRALAQLATVDAEWARATGDIDDLRAELGEARRGIAIQSSATEEALLARVDELAARHAELTETLARRDAQLAALDADGAPAGDQEAETTPGLRSPETKDLGEASQPLPLDRRGVLPAHGEDPPPGSQVLESRDDQPEPDRAEPGPTPPPDPEPPAAERPSRRQSTRMRSAYRDRRALAFWQSQIAMTFIQRRISGDGEVSPPVYFARLVDPRLRGGAAVTLRGGKPELECELLRQGACSSMTFLDNVAQRLEYAKARVPYDLTGAVDFIQADAATYVPAAPLSLVICDSVLHRVANPAAVIERIAGWLAPRGLVYVHEFVGPDRFQWTEAQLEIVNQLLACLPEKFRLDLASETGEIKTEISRPNEERFARDHPSEAVASTAIRAALDRHLQPVVVKPYGGAIFHQLFARIMGNFIRRPEIAELILEFDAILTDHGVVGSDYLWAAYRKPV